MTKVMPDTKQSVKRVFRDPDSLWKEWAGRRRQLVFVGAIFFDAKDVDAAVGIACDNLLTIVEERTAEWVSVAVEGSEQLSGVRFHTFSVLSEDAETARCRSGVTATVVTASVWPERVRRSRRVTREDLSETGGFGAEISGLPIGVRLAFLALGLRAPDSF